MFLFYLVIGALQMFFDDDDDDESLHKQIGFQFPVKQYLMYDTVDS